MFRLKPLKLTNFVLRLTKTTEIDWNLKSSGSFVLVLAKTDRFQLILEMGRKQCNASCHHHNVSLFWDLYFLFCASFIGGCLIQAWCLSWWQLVCSNFLFPLFFFLLLAWMDVPSVSEWIFHLAVSCECSKLCSCCGKFLHLWYTWCFAFFACCVHTLEYNFFKVATLYIFLTMAYLLLIIRMKCLWVFYPFGHGLPYCLGYRIP